jgi:hypothetical protein
VNVLDARIAQLQEQGEGAEEATPEAPATTEVEVEEPTTTEETSSAETEQVSAETKTAEEEQDNG